MRDVDANKIREWYKQKEALVGSKQKGIPAQELQCGAGRKAVDHDPDKALLSRIVDLHGGYLYVSHKTSESATGQVTVQCYRRYSQYSLS